jgi:hypothetical protein
LFDYLTIKFTFELVVLLPESLDFLPLCEIKVGKVEASGKDLVMERLALTRNFLTYTL